VAKSGEEANSSEQTIEVMDREFPTALFAWPICESDSLARHLQLHDDGENKNRSISLV
jgi:hypothetical protein